MIPRPSPGKLRALIIFAIILTSVSCDQISKTIVRQSITYDEHFRFMGNHVALMKVENPGAFLSLGHAWPLPLKFIVLAVLPSLVLLSVFVFLLRKSAMHKAMQTGLCFIIGGGVGNLYDRFVFGTVTDFLHLDFRIFKTGVFNMADVSIMAGLIIVLVYFFLERTPEKTVDKRQ
jgi:signal peptidase II